MHGMPISIDAHVPMQTFLWKPFLMTSDDDDFIVASSADDDDDDGDRQMVHESQVDKDDDDDDGFPNRPIDRSIVSNEIECSVCDIFKLIKQTQQQTSA